MPLYEYQCEACAHRFEAIQKFSDSPLETCPKCGGHVHKLIAAPAFQFKGSGWYITDYAKKDAPAASKPEGTKKEESKDAAPGKTESPAKADTSAKAETATTTKPD
jgi:putative FmdB family regulatory protein